jgi:hypothetical protein
MKYVAAENIGTRIKIHKRMKLSEKPKKCLAEVSDATTWNDEG